MIPSKPGQKSPGPTGSYRSQKYDLPRKDKPNPSPAGANPHAINVKSGAPMSPGKPTTGSGFDGHNAVHKDRAAAVLDGRVGAAPVTTGGFGAHRPVSDRIRSQAAHSAGKKR